MTADLPALLAVMTTTAVPVDVPLGVTRVTAPVYFPGKAERVRGFRKRKRDGKTTAEAKRRPP